MSKQSSIEWLVEQIKKDINLRLRGFDIDKAFEQAKAMHKEEIMDAFQLGKWDWSEHLEKDTESKDPMQYYNETFNQ